MESTFKTSTKYFFMMLLWVYTIRSTCCQWTLSITKQPCQDNGEFEFQCCRDNSTSVMLDIRKGTNGPNIASTDYNTFSYFNKTAYPDYGFTFNTVCATLTIGNINEALYFTCTMGSHILSTSVTACSTAPAGNSAAQTSVNENIDYETGMIVSIVLLSVAIIVIVILATTIWCNKVKNASKTTKQNNQEKTWLDTM